MGTIERRIQFYQIIGLKGDKYIKLSLEQMNSLLSEIPIISTADSSFDIYIERFNSSSLTGTQLDRSYWKISKIRKTDLPLKYDLIDKKSSPLDLRENEGLQEPSHFIIFNGSIIGSELNFNAPRVATTLNMQIRNYLESHQHEPIDGIEINPMVREDAYKKIDKMDEISSIMIKISTNYARTLNNIAGERDYSFGRTFASSEAAEDMYLGVQFYLGRGRKPRPKAAWKQIISDIRALFRQPDSFDNIEAARVRGKQIGAESPELIDLLEDSLMVQRKIARLDDKTKAVDPIDMYENILDSYKILKREIDEYISPIVR